MFKLFVLVAVVAVAFADHIDKDATIRSINNEIKEDGSYNSAFETSNGISVQEDGIGGQYARGTAQWYAPDGTPVYISYVADANGYQPTGSHIPTPPPVPEYILRALEWTRTHPYKEPVRRF